MIQNKDLQLLRDFFSAYFHQGWDAGRSNTADVIKEFLTEGHSPSHLTALANSITQLTRQTEDEVEIEDYLFKTLGCYYTPSLDGQAASQWLQEIAQTLSPR